MRVNITEGVQGLGPEGAKDEAKSGLQGRRRGFSIFDVFAPTQENPRTRTSSRTRTIGDLRTIERKEKRAIEYQIFLEISSSLSRFRSSIVLVLVLILLLPDRREFR